MFGGGWLLSWEEGDLDNRHQFLCVCRCACIWKGYCVCVCVCCANRMHFRVYVCNNNVLILQLAKMFFQH